MSLNYWLKTKQFEWAMWKLRWPFLIHILLYFRWPTGYPIEGHNNLDFQININPKVNYSNLEFKKITTD